ncbi:hypothetical protein ACTMTI_49105 [Nonomuraea sp. H19]|uniref:hypothetical protein n=1 Tax=Nonomuraea sp. H19 TaxID=3452206 RepID=UPI003F8AA203
MRIDDLLIDGPRFAARCYLSTDHRKLGHVVIEWILIGEVTEDGRVRHIDQLGRTLGNADSTGGRARRSRVPAAHREACQA